MTTLDLFSTIGVVVVPDHQPEATIQERFEAFAAANPWVGEALEGMALDLHRRGPEADRREDARRAAPLRVRAVHQRPHLDVPDQQLLRQPVLTVAGRTAPELGDAIELRELKA